MAISKTSLVEPVRGTSYLAFQLNSLLIPKTKVNILVTI
jgi:hypothetical protein